MSDAEIELAKEHSVELNKYVYFLLAVAASGIAFAVQKTSGSPLALPQILLGLAVLCWAFSFYAGCRNRDSNSCMLQANYHGNVATGSVKNPEAARKDFDAHNLAAVGWLKWQFRLLVIGALFFLGWHIWTMALTPRPVLC